MVGPNLNQDDRNKLNVGALRFDYDVELAESIESMFQVSSHRSHPNYRIALDARRRNLLGDAIRVTQDLLPRVYDAFAQCLQLLEVSNQSGDLFVQHSAEYNANIVSDGQHFDIVVNSALAQDFTSDELRFVFGHELGHMLYSHSEISVPGLLDAYSDMPAETALMLFRWSRSAEISADRIGLLCSGSLDAAVSALFKTSSGMSNVPPEAVLASYRRQYDELKTHIETVGGPHGWARTHPMSPIRFKALEMASLDMVALASGAETFSWKSFRKLDREIAATLGALDTTAPASKGLRSEDGQTALFTILLYVAVSDGTLAWKQRWFIHDVHNVLNSSLPIEKMIDAVTSDFAIFKSSAMMDLHADREALDTDDASRALELCSLMVAIDPDDGTTYGEVINEVAEALGIPSSDIPDRPQVQQVDREAIRRVLRA
jgi:hypothetical protein